MSFCRFAVSAEEGPCLRSSRPLNRAARLGVVAGLMAMLAGCQALSSLSTSSEIKESAFRPSDNAGHRRHRSRATTGSPSLPRAQHPRILATYGGEYSDPKLERMVAKVVGSLTTVSGNPGQTYRITILNSPNVNAFALPGGYLYVTRGLLALANDSAELAAVIAHEMGHVTANHGLQRQQKEAEEVLATKVVTDVLGGNPNAKRRAAARQAPAGAVLAQPGTRGRRDRHQGERPGGLRPLRRRPLPAIDGGLHRFPLGQRRHGRQPRLPGQPSERAAAHRTRAAPCPAVRPAGRRARATATPSSPASTACSTATRRRKAMCAATPSCIRGLGVSFSVPAGFVIDNSAAAVTATGPGDWRSASTASRSISAPSCPTTSARGWVAGLDPTSVRTLTINGNEAATARAAADGWKFDITVIRSGGQVYRLLTAAPLNSDQLDAVAVPVGASFKLLSAREKAALKPLRIRVVTVKPGQTIGSIAAMMVGVDRKLELFRVLNALACRARRVSAGDKVKIITDS